MLSRGIYRIFLTSGAGLPQGVSAAKGSRISARTDMLHQVEKDRVEVLDLCGIKVMLFIGVRCDSSQFILVDFVCDSNNVYLK